jgi:lipoprotein-anchoring transpeptidase ErfK/SrfK
MKSPEVHAKKTPSPKRVAHKSAVPPTQELVALLAHHQARSKPRAGSAPLDLVPAKTPITEERTMLPVLRRDKGWLKVRLPGRPNSHSGWIDESQARLLTTPWHVLIDLSRRQVVAYRKGHRVRAFEAVIGKPSTPTPRGEFFVEESLALSPGDPGEPYALALSARSDVFQEFEGGPGQVAIHGISNIGGVPGTAVSHGCIRLETQAMRWLALHIPTGAPVTITR